MSAPGVHDERMHGRTGEMHGAPMDGVRVERVEEEIEALSQTVHDKVSSETHNNNEETMPVNDMRAPNVFERVKEEIEALTQKVHEKKSSETHGVRKDMDETTPLSDVKAPNVFERAQEEIEALVQTIHLKKETRPIRKETHGVRKDIYETTPVDEVKAPNVFERVKEEIDALVQTIHLKKETQPNSKETHGVRKDIDESTPVDEVKAPNVFERTKEEIDALVQTINQRKDARPSETRDHTTQPATTTDGHDSSSGKNKASDFIKKTKDDIKDMMLAKLSPRQHKKSRDENNHIDKGTPLSKVKGPNVFERAKEEIDALVEVIHQKKEAKRESRTAAQGSDGGR